MRQRKAQSVRAQLNGNRFRLTSSFRNGRKDRQAHAVRVRDFGRPPRRWLARSQPRLLRWACHVRASVSGLRAADGGCAQRLLPAVGAGRRRIRGVQAFHAVTPGRGSGVWAGEDRAKRGRDTRHGAGISHRRVGAPCRNAWCRGRRSATAPRSGDLQRGFQSHNTGDVPFARSSPPVRLRRRSGGASPAALCRRSFFHLQQKIRHRPTRWLLLEPRFDPRVSLLDRRLPKLFLNFRRKCEPLLAAFMLLFLPPAVFSDLLGLTLFLLPEARAFFLPDLD